MKIVHIAATDIAGGAARSAYRLHMGLRELGADSRMVVLSRASGDPAVQTMSVDHRLPARALRKLWRLRQGPFAQSHRPLGSRSLEIFSIDRSPLGTSLLNSLPDAEIFNLHWAAGMFDFEILSELCRRAQVVWTLHDMNPFTGGCHFDEACGRFRDACGRCPQLDSSNPSDLSAAVLRRKNTVTSTLPQERLTIVAPSIWLTQQAQTSSVFKRFHAQTIPYGLETDVFQPRDPRIVREIVDIPATARVVLFLAEGINNRRKGFDLLVNALRNLGDLTNTWLLVVGGGFRPDEYALPLPTRVIPTVHDDRLLSYIYSAADVFVMASRADNLPNTVLESLCCGTPVAGFAVGGVPDLVIQGDTGHLVPAGDSSALSGAVRALLNSDEASRQAMRRRCREHSLSNYQLAKQAATYQDLYRRLTAHPGHGSPVTELAARAEAV